LNGTIATSGSNYASIIANIPTGSWTTLQSGSNVDFRTGVFSNNDLTSSIYIAIGNTGATSSILQPDDSCILTYSGSIPIYARTVGTNSPASLGYTLVSFN